MALRNLFGELGLESTLQSILSVLTGGTLKVVSPNHNKVLVGNAQERFRDEFFTFDRTKWNVYTGVLGSVALAPDTDTPLGTAFSNGITLSLSGGGAGSRYLQVDTGVTPGAEVVVESVQTFSLPFKVGAGFSLSQRIANQEFYLECVGVDTNGNVEHDSTFPTTNLENETNAAAWLFSALSTTTALSVVRGMGTPELVSGNITIGTTTPTGTSPNFMPATIYETALDTEEACFVNRGIDTTNVSTGVSKRTQNLPDPGKSYKVRLRVRNASAGVAATPSGATQARLHFVRVIDTTRLSVDWNRYQGRNDSSTALPVYTVNATSSNVALASISGTSPNLFTETTTAILAANGTQTGSSRDSGSTASNQLFVVDVFSPTDGVLKSQASTDGTTWWDSEVKAVAAGVPATINKKVSCRYNRAIFTNGTTAQTTGNPTRLTSAYHKI